jgi:hypothetical protein
MSFHFLSALFISEIIVFKNPLMNWVSSSGVAPPWNIFAQGLEARFSRGAWDELSAGNARGEVELAVGKTDGQDIRLS